MGRARSLLTIALAAAAVTPALLPLLRAPWFGSHDGDFHLWRVWEYWRVWEGGTPLPGWAPDFIYGYGAPVFLYYTPVPYVLAAFWCAIGASAADALRIVLAFSLVASFVGAWRFTDVWLGDRASRWTGLLGGSAFLYAPYRLLDVYVRGAVAESVALGIAPFLCWAIVRRHREQGHATTILVAALAALLLLSHTVSTLTLLPVFGLLVAVKLAREWRRRGWGAAGDVAVRLGRAGVLAACLSAPWLAPVVWGQTWVRVAEAIGTPDLAKWQLNLVPLKQLVQWSVVHDYALDFPRDYTPDRMFVPHLGVWVLALTVAGIAVSIWRGQIRRDWPLMVLAAGSVVLILPESARLWQHVPGLPIVQFPWRFLGTLALVSAPLVGGMVAKSRPNPPVPADVPPLRVAEKGLSGDGQDSRLPGARHPAFGIPRQQSRRGDGDRGKHLPPAVAIVLAAVTVLAGVGGLNPEPVDWSRSRESWQGSVSYERRTKVLGTMADDEFVPVWLTLPRPLVAIAEPPPEQASAVPADVRLLRADALTRRLEVRADAATSLVFDTLYFPTWHTEVDGRPTPARPVGPLGLLALDVPSGAHVVEIGSGFDAASLALGLIAVVSLGVIFALAPRRGALVGAIAALAIASPLAWMAATRPSPAWSTVHDPARLGDRASVIGYSVDARRTSECGQLEVALMLHTRGASPTDLPIHLELTSPAGGPVLDDYHLPNLGTRLPTRWAPNEILVDRAELTLRAGTPPGRYSLLVGLGDGPATPVGAVDLTSSAGVCPVSALLQPRAAHEGSVGGYVLEAFDTDPPPVWGLADRALRRAGPGDALEYHLTWRLTDSLRLHPTVVLVASDGRVVAGSRWPWQTASSRMATAHRIVVPADAPPGTYSVLVSGQDESGHPAPARASADAPISAALPLEYVRVGPAGGGVPVGIARTDVAFGPRIRLLGYTQSFNGDALAVTLYWTSETRPTDDETVFVQVSTPEGDALGQVDSPPHGGLARTTTWAPGEVVADSVLIKLSRAVPRVVTRVGMYRTLDHRPLRTTAGRDWYLLGWAGQIDYTPLVARFEDGIALRGYRLDRDLAGGASATLTLIWSAERAPTRAYQVFVHLLDSSGRLVAQADGPPEHGQRSTSEWPIGADIVDSRVLKFPAERGRGRLVIGLYDLANGARLSTGSADSVELTTLDW